MWSKKSVLGAILALLALFLVMGVYSTGEAYKRGMQNGFMRYHQQCFQIGGYIWDEGGRVVHCKPVATIPNEEMEDRRKKDALGT